MTKELLIKAIVKFVCGILFIGVLLFLPAGTIHFAKGWMFMGILFLPMFIAGLVSWIAMFIFLAAYMLYAEVLRENTYLSRTVEVQENQKVIDTGLYKIVRHPMYSATILLFLSMPLVLGSLVSFVVFLAYPFIIAKRIRNEEKILALELGGYVEYISKVRYKLIPFIW